MTAIEVKEQIRAFLSRHIKSKIEDDQNLFSSGLANSLFAMQLCCSSRNSSKSKSKTTIWT
jgi:hypothetical protein